MEQPTELSSREQEILHAVVHGYITTAEPVGSRSVVKRFGLKLSPATVRNVMADLEELGYLKQLHTSSGRVPTDLGYRYYVNYLMQVQELTLEERDRIRTEFENKISDADEVLQQTSHLLALITHQAGIAEAPSESEAEVKHLELMLIGPERLAVLIVDNYGRVRTLTLSITQPVAPAELPRLTAFLNEHLRGLRLDELSTAIQRRLLTFLDEQRRLAERALMVLSLMPAQRPAHLYLEGMTQLFEQPEFRDVEHARKVFGFLDEHERVVELLRTAAIVKDARHGPVLIGVEDGGGNPEGLSVVAAPYQVDGRPVGMVGILGPRRMQYSRLSSVVSYTAGMVGKILTKLSK